MDELIKRLRESGFVEKAIYLNVAWTHFKHGLEAGDDIMVRSNNLRIDTVMDVLEIENFLVKGEYENVSAEIYKMRKERGM